MKRDSLLRLSDSRPTLASLSENLHPYITQVESGKDFYDTVRLIAATKTETGLKIRCAIDEQHYPKGIKVPKAALKHLNIVHEDFHGDWNYSIRPQTLK